MTREVIGIVCLCIIAFCMSIYAIFLIKENDELKERAEKFQVMAQAMSLKFKSQMDDETIEELSELCTMLQLGKRDLND